MKHFVYALVVGGALVNMVKAMEPAPKGTQQDDRVTQASSCSCCGMAANSLPTKRLTYEEKKQLRIKRKKQLAQEQAKAVATVALFRAVVNNRPPNIIEALSNKAEVNKKDANGWAPIHYAARDRNVTVAKILLAVPGIDTTSVNGNGHTVLQVIQSRKECATEQHQALCDAFIKLLELHATGKYPYAIKNRWLVDVINQ